MTQLALIMPCFNEGRAAAHVIAAISALADQWQTQVGVERLLICLVDDGSSRPVQTDCASELAALKIELPAFAQLVFLRHAVNLGQGAALRTGIEFGLLRASDWFVTLDSDGQHPVVQIPDLLQPVLRREVDIVFGNRFGAREAIAMPKIRKWVLHRAAAFERFVTGLTLTDAHNGFRAMSAKTAQLMRIEQNRMAHATEIKQIVARNQLRYSEVPVTITYTDDTLAKGQRTSGAALILKDLIKQYLFEQ